jgi:hypothetical protein
MGVFLVGRFRALGSLVVTGTDRTFCGRVAPSSNVTVLLASEVLLELS